MENGAQTIRVKNAVANAKTKSVRVELLCPYFVMYDDIKAYETKFEEKVQIENIDFTVEFDVDYESFVKSQQNVIQLKCSILEMIKDRFPGAAPFFGESDFRFSERRIEIDLSPVAEGIAKQIKIDEEIVKYISQFKNGRAVVAFIEKEPPKRKGSDKIRQVVKKTEGGAEYVENLGADTGDEGLDNMYKDVVQIDNGFSQEEYERSKVTGKKGSGSSGAGKYNSNYKSVYGGGGAKKTDNYKGAESGKKKRILTPKEGEELQKDKDGNTILLGGEITEKPVKMCDLDQDSGFVALKGRIFRTEQKPIPSGSIIEMIDITDETGSIRAKFFYEPEDTKFVNSNFKPGKYIKVYGQVEVDKFSNDAALVMKVRNISTFKPQKRMDNAEVKRVELHLHTTMSAVDAITRCDELVETVTRWGHTAIGITDHGVVQAYPDMFNAKGKQKSPIKLIYGMECYLTDQIGEISKEEAKNTKSWHCIILVKNAVGLKNLYKLISKSNLNYFYKKPRIPRFELEAHREGLIIGSACSEGEFFHAVYTGATEEELLRMGAFYDYLEIQPAENDMYLVRRGDVESLTALRQLSKKVVEIADKLGKMTVATCDVHFLNPEDAIYRSVMQAGQGYTDFDQQPPLYLRTTDEMLAEFDYLGDRAYEIVVENTNKIADMIEEIRPVPDGFYPPVIDGSDDQLRNSSYEKAKKTYGDPIPDHILARLDRELNAIIGNGYSIMYITAKELVAESARNGYTVGSRGSVGSSLAAYMSGITEVNSLPPHYRCEKCFYQEFFFNQEYEAGCDMPDKECPNCHTPLIKDGFDIPFETFLGFNGDKVPDIDLNFANGDQQHAHAYTEVLFGKGYVYRAGTISGLAEESAKGYVRKYLEKTGKHVSETEVARLASGFQGVKKTTGQHPGGIIVVPRGYEIQDFTPVQHPADDPDSEIVTTHFDYHFLHETILKLDILGHDGPAMIKYLEEFTGVDAMKIDLSDKKTMSLFTSTEALNMDPSLLKIDIPIGVLGIPEFGTHFAKGMLLETMPTHVSELIRLAGLSHGTDVWNGNAQDLIRDGTCTLSEAICCRDDIMLFLIKMGLDKKLSFKIMEKVRKGKGLEPSDEEEMRAHDVPEWYIGSCKKIKYMFPKAHAVAYVMLSVRVAWFKVYYPIAYYCTRFTLKIDDFDATYMIHGLDKAYMRMMDLQKAENKSAKDEDQLTLYEQLMELYARRIEFLPVDLYKSQAVKFVPEDGKIRPPFCAIAGVGVNAAKQLEAARDDGLGVYETIEDLRQRSNVNKSVIEALRAEGVLDGMSEDGSISLFDL